jgi:hypothetical protein
MTTRELYIIELGIFSRGSYQSLGILDFTQWNKGRSQKKKKVWVVGH